MTVRRRDPSAVATTPRPRDTWTTAKSLLSQACPTSYYRLKHARNDDDITVERDEERVDEERVDEGADGDGADGDGTDGDSADGMRPSARGLGARAVGGDGLEPSPPEHLRRLDVVLRV